MSKGSVCGFARRPRYFIHFTPTGASWLNWVERFFGEITQRWIRRGSFDSVRQLGQAIADYLDHHNRGALARHLLVLAQEGRQSQRFQVRLQQRNGVTIHATCC